MSEKHNIFQKIKRIKNKNKIMNNIEMSFVSFGFK